MGQQVFNNNNGYFVQIVNSVSEDQHVALL